MLNEAVGKGSRCSVYIALGRPVFAGSTDGDDRELRPQGCKNVRVPQEGDDEVDDAEG